MIHNGPSPASAAIDFLPFETAKTDVYRLRLQADPGDAEAMILYLWEMEQNVAAALSDDREIKTRSANALERWGALDLNSPTRSTIECAEAIYGEMSALQSRSARRQAWFEEVEEGHGATCDRFDALSPVDRTRALRRVEADMDPIEFARLYDAFGIYVVAVLQRPPTE